MATLRSGLHRSFQELKRRIQPAGEVLFPMFLRPSAPGVRRTSSWISRHCSSWAHPSPLRPVQTHPARPSTLWVMIIPMLLKVGFGARHQIGQHWRGIGVTLFVNWAVKPFSMALLARGQSTLDAALARSSRWSSPCWRCPQRSASSVSRPVRR